MKSGEGFPFPVSPHRYPPSGRLLRREPEGGTLLLTAGSRLRADDSQFLVGPALGGAIHWPMLEAASSKTGMA